MKQLLTIPFILIIGFCYGQTSILEKVKKHHSVQAKKDSISKVDTVAKLTNDTPLLTLNDLDKVLLSLDDKLLNKDHKAVTLALQAAIIEAEKRKNKIKK